MASKWSLEAVMPALTQRAVHYIEAADEQPFFLYFPLTAPHTPIVPTDEFKGMSRAGEYGDFVCEVDWTVGEVMAALDRKGIAENTLLIFTSDNGPENFAYRRIRECDHYSMDGLRGLKRDAWEGGHRVPFIARWPERVAPGRVCDEVICLSDFTATAGAIAGAPLTADVAEDSYDLLPALLNEPAVPIREATVHHSMRGKFAIRKGRWVLIDAPSGDDNAEPQWLKEERGVRTPRSAGRALRSPTRQDRTVQLLCGIPRGGRGTQSIARKVSARGPKRFSLIKRQIFDSVRH